MKIVTLSNYYFRICSSFHFEHNDHQPPSTLDAQAVMYSRLAVQLGTNIVSHDWDPPQHSSFLMEKYIRAANSLVSDPNGLNDYADACLNVGANYPWTTLTSMPSMPGKTKWMKGTGRTGSGSGAWRGSWE